MKAKTSTPELKRLRGGPLLSTFLENMISADRMSEKKAFLYSAHDATLMKLMATLDILDPIMPPYSAALIMELHKSLNGDEKYVEVGIKLLSEILGISVNNSVRRFPKLSKSYAMF